MDIFRVELDEGGGAGAEVTPRLRLVGEMDAGTVDVFRAAIAELGEIKGRVMLDLSELDFIDSTALGALVAVHKRFRERDGDLVLTNVRPRVTKLLELTGLDKAFTIA